MLRITIPSSELFNEELNEFIYIKEKTIELEHSLISISKWESKYHKPFMGNYEKTMEEQLYYIQCMTIKPVDSKVYLGLTNDVMRQINDYIKDPMSATTIPSSKNKSAPREKITSELIYYWMISLNIPFECEKWNLNRLIKLIEVCNFKNKPQKNMSAKDLAAQNRALNAARRKKFHSKG